MAYLNGGIWALGNGMVSTTLILYLALDRFDSRSIGLGIGLLLALPKVIGTLRLVAPPMIGRLARKKEFCLGAYMLSALTLLTLVPITVGAFSEGPTALAMLIAVWGVFHLLEYMGTIALWSWLADVAPARIRGRFIGRRQRWMIVGEIVALLASGGLVWLWQACTVKESHPIGYMISSTIGIGLLLIALLPLCRMSRSRPRGRNAGRVVDSGLSLRALLAPLGDSVYLRFLAAGIFFSLACGITQTPQSCFPRYVLGLPLIAALSLKVGLRMGQLPLAPWVGRMADRLGNLPVMAIGMLIAATGPLFFIPAASHSAYWIIGAQAAWIAWIGVNVAQPNLLLKLSPRGADTPHIAIFFAITGLVWAMAATAGGWLYDMTDHGRAVLLTLPTVGDIDYYTYAFLAGWILRTLSAVLLVALMWRPLRGASSPSPWEGRP